MPELFIVELPQDEAGWKQPSRSMHKWNGNNPARATAWSSASDVLTFTHHRRLSGVSLVNVPRHWVRCNHQGTQIAFLMRDDNGIVQLWLISLQGGEPHQLTHNKSDIQSAFNWHPSGEWLGFVLDNRIACCLCRKAARLAIWRKPIREIHLLRTPWSSRRMVNGWRGWRRWTVIVSCGSPKLIS
ncbi:hypothetical protein MF573_27285 [Klebsiella pneumoniae]|nr:hypothetical protein MF573_27285 [Klebsiella pneumoniae]